MILVGVGILRAQKKSHSGQAEHEGKKRDDQGYILHLPVEQSS